MLSDTLVIASETRLTRVQGFCHSMDWVDMSTSLFVLKIDANPKHKRLNLYVRALLFLRHSPCWNKHSSTSSSQCAQLVIRVMSRRDMMSQMELGFIAWLPQELLQNPVIWV